VKKKGNMTQKKGKTQKSPPNLKANGLLEGLSQRQGVFIIKLLETGSISKAAKSLKLCRGDYYKWLKDPKFKEALKNLRSGLLDNAINDFSLLLTECVKVFQEALIHTDIYLQIRAANNIIEHLYKFRELEGIEDLDARITALEKIINEKKGG
jgi:hypothetical protein